MAMAYITAVATVLVGFVSFAVDYGRVQLAKTELQGAATAAARAAVAQLSTSISAAQTAATTVAATNTADGTPITLDVTKDIDFGTWNDNTRSFVALFGAARGNANAVRITAQRLASRGNALNLTFARVVG